MYTRGRFLSRISPFDLLEEPFNRRGFILRGQTLANDGTEVTLISDNLADDWYHLRYLTWFDDAGLTLESDNRLVLRANGSPLGEYFGVFILPYIGKRHLVRIEAVAPPRSLFEAVYLNNGGLNHTPELVITGYRSRFQDRIE